MIVAISLGVALLFLASYARSSLVRLLFFVAALISIAYPFWAPALE
jgi:hypothetical protein